MAWGALAVQRVGGDDRPVQVSDGVQDRNECGQLVGADHLDLSDRQLIGVVEDRDQLGLFPVLVAGAAQRLAVHGQHCAVLTTASCGVGRLPPAVSAAGYDPAGQGALHCDRVDRGQHPAERGRVRCRPADGHPLLSAASPLGDRRIRAGTGQHGADRQQQDRLQTVTTASGLARIGDRSQGLQ